jgi:hypothetical protein
MSVAQNQPEKEPEPVVVALKDELVHLKMAI